MPTGKIEASSNDASREQSPAAGSRLAWYRAAATCVLLLLGAFEGWYKRTDFSTDAISYLDISRAIPLKDWKMVFNPLWSLGYPLLLSLARPLFPATENGEWLSIHAVNFAVFIATWLAFLFLLRSFEGVIAERPDAAARKSFLFLSGTCIFASIQLCIDSVSRVGPDLMVTLFFFLATAMVVRLVGAGRHAPAGSSWSRAALLGLVLGLGYWTKGIFLALSVTLLLSTAAALIVRKRKAAPILLAFAVFAVVAAPYAAGLSWSYGRFTLGESGPMNYAWHVNLLPRWTNWQGEPGGFGKPVHPTHEISRNPEVFTFAEPYHNTYPPFGNATYWYQGYRHFFSPRYQAIGIARDLQYLVKDLAPQPILYAVLLAVILVMVSVTDREAWLATVSRLWPYYLPAAIAILLYIQVHLEDRYLGSFLSILSLLPFLSLALMPGQLSGLLPRGRARLVLAVLALGAALNYAIVDRDVFVHARSHSTYAENAQWKLGLALERAGLAPGDAMAVVGGPNASCTWAYIAHLRIVAELGGEPFDQRHPVPPSTPSALAAFWHASPAEQHKVVQLFQQAGAVAAIASDKPADVPVPAGWQHMEGTDTWLYRLR